MRNVNPKILLTFLALTYAKTNIKISEFNGTSKCQSNKVLFTLRIIKKTNKFLTFEVINHKKVVRAPVATVNRKLLPSCRKHGTISKDSYFYS